MTYACDFGLPAVESILACLKPQSSSKSAGGFSQHMDRFRSTLLTEIRAKEQSMDQAYRIDDTSGIFTPALVFYRDRIQKNIDQAIQCIGGHTDRLRPHVKTHKTREIVKMELASGIRKHKCATIVEAEMIASCGIGDVLLAYNLVGPNQARLAAMMKHYPKTEFKSLIDHPAAARSLSEVMDRAGLSAPVMLDLDTGMQRTGIPIGDEAEELYQLAADLPGLTPAGFHVYDGQNHQSEFAEREQAALKIAEDVEAFKSRIEEKGLPVPSRVMGGTATFPIYAKLDGLECSPGTCFLSDHSYGTKFPDIDYTPAAMMLTRVISRPSPDRITLDLGYKALASDPPVGNRCHILGISDADMVLQNEEHLVVQTAAAGDYQPGDDVYAQPTHICPTCALHKEAIVVENHQVVDRWEIAARDRCL